jgi:hypothetical protein
LTNSFFPSVTGSGRNVAINLANAGAGSVTVRNRDEVLAAYIHCATGLPSGETQQIRRTSSGTTAILEITAAFGSF